MKSIGWELKSKDAIHIDETRKAMNLATSMYFWQKGDYPVGLFPHVSLTTQAKALEAAEEVRERARKFKPGNQFDSLVVRDADTNARIVSNVFSYFHNPDDHRFNAFLDRVYGEGTYEALLDSVRPQNYPHDIIHRATERKFELGCVLSVEPEAYMGSPTNFTREKGRVLEQVKQRYGHVKRFVADLKQAGSLDGLIFDLAPASSPFSTFDGGVFMCAIGLTGIYVVRKGNGFEVLESMCAPTAVHEIAGHAVQNKLSDKYMPAGLRDSTNESLRFIHGPVSEGVALETEEFGFEHMKKHQKLWGLTEQEISDAQILCDAYIPRQLPQLVYSAFWFERMAWEDVKNMPPLYNLEPSTRLARLMGTDTFRKDKNELKDLSFEDFAQYLSYWAGQRRIRPMHNAMKTMGVPPEVAFRAIHLGLWCDAKAQRDFIFKIELPAQGYSS